LKSLFQKCPNLKILYLNAFFDRKSLELIVNAFERHECLCIDYHCLLALRYEELEIFSVSLSKRLIHFSIRDFVGNQLINRKIIALLRNLSTLRKLKVLLKEKVLQTF
jgi:hypothetical protein